MSEPWTREEQVNYSVFGSKVAPPEWRAAWEAVGALAKATGHEPGQRTIFDHLNNLLERYISAGMSVD